MGLFRVLLFFCPIHFVLVSFSFLFLFSLVFRTHFPLLVCLFPFVSFLLFFRFSVPFPVFLSFYFSFFFRVFFCSSNILFFQFLELLLFEGVSVPHFANDFAL